jgi:hypothetical protein
VSKYSIWLKLSEGKKRHWKCTSFKAVNERSMSDLKQNDSERVQQYIT